MTPEDKALISEYMQWIFFYKIPDQENTVIHYSGKQENKWGTENLYGFGYNENSFPNNMVEFNLNDAGLCVEKMVEKGDLEDFEYHVIHCHLSATDSMTQWLFSADNFFQAMASWLRGRK